MKSTDYYIQTIANLVRAQGDLADKLTEKDAEIAALKAKLDAPVPEDGGIDMPKMAPPNTATFDEHGQATP